MTIILLFTWVPQKAEPEIKAYVPELHQDVWSQAVRQGGSMASTRTLWPSRVLEDKRRLSGLSGGWRQTHFSTSSCLPLVKALPPWTSSCLFFQLARVWALSVNRGVPGWMVRVMAWPQWGTVSLHLRAADGSPQQWRPRGLEVVPRRCQRVSFWEYYSEGTFLRQSTNNSAIVLIPVMLSLIPGVEKEVNCHLSWLPWEIKKGKLSNSVTTSLWTLHRTGTGYKKPCSFTNLSWKWGTIIS